MTAEPYDFRNPSRRAGPLDKGVGGWLRASCALTAKRWTRHLSFLASLRLKDLTSTVPTTAKSRLPAEGVAVEIGTGVPKSLLVFPHSAMLALLAGLFGETPADVPEPREYSAVETGVTNYLVQVLVCDVFREGWPGKQAPSLKLGKRSLEPQTYRGFPSDENLSVATLGLTLPVGPEQDLHWLLPKVPWLQELTGSTDAPATRPDRGQMEQVVRGVGVQLEVVLGSAEVPLAQLANLRPGDVIVLRQPVAAPLTATIDGNPTFRVWPGAVGPWQAIEIQARLGR